MSRLGGSTAPRAAGGSSAAGASASTSSTAPDGGTMDTGAVAAGLSVLGPAGGATGLGATGTTTAPEPNGAATPLGRLYAGTLTPHAHEDGATGGVVAYARLVVAATPPAAPATPSDAFWLNPEEEA
jgi:hypothetical protein